MCSSLVRERLFDIRREGKALSDTPREAAQACIAAVAGKHIIEFGQIIGRIVTHPGARQGAEGETMRTFELTTSCHQDATDHRLTLYNREEISDDLPGHHLVLNVSEASGAPYDQIHLSYNLYDAEIDRHPALALRVHGYCLRRYDEPFTTVVEPHQRQGMKVINSLSALRQINRKIDHAASLPALEQM